MPLNLTKQYNSVLDLLYPSLAENINSLRRVFDKDFTHNNNLSFRTKKIHPTTSHEGKDALEILFTHLTTQVVDEKTKKREFETERSVRIHWIRYHLEESKKQNIIVFSVIDEESTYILDKDERYVIILRLLRNKAGFYLLTAYRLGKASYKKIMTKYEKRGVDGHL